LLTISQGIHPEYQPGRESLPRETCIRNSHSRFGEFVLKAPLEGGTLGSYPTGGVRRVNAQSKSHRPTREFRPCELPPKRQHRAHVPGPVWHLDSLQKEGTDVQGSSPVIASATHPLLSPTAPPPRRRETEPGRRRKVDGMGKLLPCPTNEPGRRGSLPAFNSLEDAFNIPVLTQAPPTHGAGPRACTPPLTLAMDVPLGRVCVPACSRVRPRPTKIPQLTVPRSVLGSPSPAVPSSREGDRSGRALFDWGEPGGSRIGAFIHYFIHSFIIHS
jgi:hypothetical protein